VLFSYSDSAILPALGLYREEALAENGGYQKVEGKFQPLPVPDRANPTILTMGLSSPAAKR
jgi:hypothetical protein